jgi:energy-coupling factor transport system substrate-specific component
MNKDYLNGRVSRISCTLLFTILAIFLMLGAVFSHKGSTVYATSADNSSEDSLKSDSEEARVTAPAPDETGLGIGYSAVLYDSSNGLPTSEANAVAQTGDGFVWIGSYSGLIRYDGTEFYRFDSSVGITSVVSLFVDSKDRLWIGTNDNGVALYEDGEFTFYGRESGLGSMSVRSISEDGYGDIIIATTSGISYVDENLKLQNMDIEELNDQYIYSIKNDADGTIYGVTTNGVLFYIENKKLMGLYDGNDLGFGPVYSVVPDLDREGYVYLGTEDSNIIYGDITKDMADCEKYSVSPQVDINAILPVNDNELWVCADNGIGFLDEDRHYVEIQNIPMNNSVDNMMLDYEGNLWFVSSRQGVMKIAPSQFTDVNLVSGLPTMVVNTTCMYQDNLYIGTDSGLYILDEDYGQVTNDLTQTLDGVRVRSIKTDSKGNMWLCTYGETGLMCYKSDGSWECYGAAQGITSDHVRTLIETSDGRIAVATGGGLFIMQDGKVTASYAETEGVTNTEILSLCEGENGDIYFGSDGGGLFVLDSEGNLSKIGVDQGLKSEVILRVKRDEISGLIWIITSNSISYLRDGVVTTLNNFPYSNNFDIFFDESDRAWVLASNGIYVVDMDELLEDAEPEYTFYDGDCGMPYSITANSRSCLLEDGTLYMCGASGVATINIYESDKETGPVKLAVPYIGVDDEILYVPESGEITIPSGTKRLTIYGYVLTYSLSNPRVSYYLDGFDESETSVTRQNLDSASYTNLAGGKYVYHISVINSITGEVENSIEITINKKKSLDEQWWFWLVILVLIVLLAAGCSNFYTRHKTRELRKREQENKTFIRQMIQAFARAIDVKDSYTNGHSFRVAKYTAIIAENMGYSDEEVESIRNIAMLHDIGKISIPNEILNKPGKLTDEEYEIIKTHASKGYDILKEIEILPDLALGAAYHHERIDGRGYPSGKKGDEIPVIAQIIAVADTFDAMNSTRPYRKKMNMEDIKAELIRVSGTQLNEKIVKIALELIENGKFDDQDVE